MSLAGTTYRESSVDSRLESSSYIMMLSGSTQTTFFWLTPSFFRHLSSKISLSNLCLQFCTLFSTSMLAKKLSRKYRQKNDTLLKSIPVNDNPQLRLNLSLLVPPTPLFTTFNQRNKNMTKNRLRMTMNYWVYNGSLRSAGLIRKKQFEFSQKASLYNYSRLSKLYWQSL